ncbi:unnamed protein product [Rhodiola kirilowii]
MTTRIGRCMRLEEAQTRQSIVKEIDFLAPNDEFTKEVTKHEDAPESEWKHWNWRSDGDLLLNGSFFTKSGAGASSSYAKASSLGARPSSLVSSLTGGAGVLSCKKSLLTLAEAH